MASECRDTALNVGWISHIDGAHVHADRGRQRLDDRKLAGAGRYRGVS
jgi:hypothetical protein